MRPPLVDTHAHLADEVFDADRDAVLARAREAGVAAVVTVGESLDDARRILALAADRPMLRPAIGLYPTRLDLDEADAIEQLIRERRERLVAIGEVGLDHWIVRDEAERETQRAIFLRQVRLADELDLPLNVHSRSAGRAAIEALLGAGARRVQLHAFDGKPSTARSAVEAGYYFSIPASVIYSRQKQKLARRLPLERLLLETDSPVMAPERGARNEPANLPLALRAVAEIRQLCEEELAEAVARNTAALYGFAV